ncbi:MAG: phosphatidate cytidylyltransferase [Firmicutes bacterium]|nr:phosphatidate cytidylyltransferase [Bacillota bacterium]
MHAILLIVFIVLLNIFYLIIFPDVKLWELALILWGIIYIGGFMAYLLALRQLPEGLSYLLLLIFGIWASDTGAYFIGLSFGKHRLAPRISPKKSLEGAAGGVVVSAIAIETLIKFSPFPLIPTGHGLLWGAIISVLGQLGDLIESAYKREAQVKDSGVILPGHGGILDRLDSLLFAAPVFYYAVLIFL